MMWWQKQPRRSSCSKCFLIRLQYSLSKLWKTRRLMRDAFSKQSTKCISVEVLSMNIRDNIQVDWAVGPAIDLRQFVQHADTLMQVDGSKPSSSTMPQSPSRLRDTQHNLSRAWAQSPSGRRRIKVYAYFAQLEVPSTDWERRSDRGNQ